MSIVSFEIVYRGIFQKSLANKISRTLVIAAAKDGKHGRSFGRYSDSPERTAMGELFFARHPAVEASERMSETQARRRERLEAERRQQPSRACVPGIRHDERTIARVQFLEGQCLVFLVHFACLLFYGLT